MEKEEMIRALAELLSRGDTAALAGLLEKTHPADIAEALDHLDEERQASILTLLDDETAAMVLLELDPEDQSRLLHVLGRERGAAILEEMPSDDIADLLKDLSPRDAGAILDLMEKEEVADVRELLAYRPDSAGGLMTTEYVALQEDMTAEEAIACLRETAPDAETIYYVYVVNGHHKLVGVLSLRDLIVAAPDTPLSQVMEKHVISVEADMDQEDVAQVVAKYDFLAVPVTDGDGKLLGIITVDDVIDVIAEETTEDMHRLGGSMAGLELIDSTVGKVRKRLPWLVVLLFGNMLSASVLSRYTGILETVVVLAYFIPVLIDMNGNVGVQSLAMVVRGLATRELEVGRLWGVLWREALVGLSLGLVTGGLVTLVAYFWQGNLLLGLIVGVAMVVTMMVAALIGTLVPMIFDALKVDPAVASGPFITTLCDVTGLTIYFSLATLMLRYLG